MFAAARAFLFDFDGTLVEPSIDFGQMHDVVLGVAGSFSLDIEQLDGMHVLELIQRGAAELATRGDGLAKAFRDRADQAVLDIELGAAGRVQAYPGVPDMLAELGKKGLGVGIVTRNARVAVDRIMTRIPMHHDVLLTRDDVPHVKPDPRHLYAALQVLGAKGSNAVMVGDHVMDISVGKRVGAITVGVLKPGSSRDYFVDAQPDLVLGRVSDLLLHLPPS